MFCLSILDKVFVTLHITQNSPLVPNSCVYFLIKYKLVCSKNRAVLFKGTNTIVFIGKSPKLYKNTIIIGRRKTCELAHK